MRYLGITFENSEKLGLENLIYVESTGCYYHKHTDSNMIMDLSVDSGYELDDGTITLYYTVGKNTTPTIARKGVVVLQVVEYETEQVYQVVSNQTIE